MAKDLLLETNVEEVFLFCEEKKIQIDVLINNVGMGDSGDYMDSEWIKQKSIIQLNILALMRLTYLFLPEMSKRKCGHVINIGSTEAFVPVAGQSVYAASKAFVVSFSQAIYEECKRDGIIVSVICPRVIKTSFFESVNLDLKYFKAADPDNFTRFVFQSMEKNKAFAIHRFSNRLIALWARLWPRGGVRRISGRMCR